MVDNMHETHFFQHGQSQNARVEGVQKSELRWRGGGEDGFTIVLQMSEGTEAKIHSPF